MRVPRLLALALGVCLALIAVPALAQAPGAAASEADAAALATAKERFREGVALIQAGDVEAALDRFLRSRAAFASSKNTLNAALCLDRLGRYDEALEMYEEVAARFQAELGPDDTTALGPAMGALRGKVGSIEVGANVDGTVVVDGKPRGKLPLTRPLRVLPGSHRIRILKDGYATAERVVEVRLGATAKLDMTLKPLAAAGQLRVEDPENVGSEVFIDRVSVGVSPWEGTLGPGRHVVWTRAQDKGSAPVEAVVVQGQTAVVKVRSGVLGPTARVEVLPSSAELSVDGTRLGAGTWEGRLPLGSHSAAALEPGYRSQSLRFEVVAAKPSTVSLRLVVDPDHPRWPKAAGRMWLGVWSGGAYGRSLNGGAESACPAACSGKTRVLAAAAALRGGFRFTFGLSLELEAGYTVMHSNFSRKLTETSSSVVSGSEFTVRYSLSDSIEIAGPFAAAGVSQSFSLSQRLALLGRVSAGALFASSSDYIIASAQGGSERQPVDVVDNGKSVRSVTLLAIPELGAEFRVGSIQVGGGLALAIFPIQGPRLPHGALKVRASCDPQDPMPASCAQDSSAVSGERAFGTFVLWMPRISAAYAF